MARGTTRVYPSKRNKGLSLTFQTPEEGRSVQRTKRCDKHGGKDEDNSPKKFNNVHDTSSQKYRQILKMNLERILIQAKYLTTKNYSKEGWFSGLEILKICGHVSHKASS